MPAVVKEVEYFYAEVADRPGEARKLLEFLSEKQVNLQAFTAFPLGDGRSQLDFFPVDAVRFLEAVAAADLSVVGPKRAFLIQGEDKVGALYHFHLTLSNAGINVHAANGAVDGTGRFGYVVWVKPSDYDKALEALRASDWKTIQTSPPGRK